MSYSVQQEKVYVRLRTRASRFLIDPVTNAAQPREVAQVLHYVRQPGDIRSLVVSGSAVHPLKILMDGGFSTPF